MNKLKAIKIIVFVLTFLLILGMLAALSLVAKNIKQKSPAINKDVYLNEPDGSEISSISHADGKTYLLIKQGGLSDRITILDNANNIVAKINIKEAKNDKQ